MASFLKMCTVNVTQLSLHICIPEPTLKQLALVEFGWGLDGIELLFTAIMNVPARLLDHQVLRLCYCGDYVPLFPGFHCKYSGDGPGRFRPEKRQADKK